MYVQHVYAFVFRIYEKIAITKSKRVKLCGVSLARLLLCVVQFITGELNRQNPRGNNDYQDCGTTRFPILAVNGTSNHAAMLPPLKNRKENACAITISVSGLQGQLCKLFKEKNHHMLRSNGCM